MKQTLNVSIAGKYTSPNDLNGVPPGALDQAMNVESRYKNILEPRRGFDSLVFSEIAGSTIIRLINFPILGADKLIALTDDGDLFYYDAIISKTFPAAAVIVAADTFTIANHGFTVGRLVQIVNPGTLPGGIVALTDYYVIVINANTIQVATSYTDALLGTQVPIASQGVGTNTITTVNAWAPLPGNYADLIDPPNATFAKSRFIRAGQDLYMTSLDGIRFISSGSGSLTLPSGVPKALNGQAETNGDESGFLSNNVALSTFGRTANGSPIIQGIADLTGIVVGQYVTGEAIKASRQIQNLLYFAFTAGAAGNAITVTYTAGGVAGAEVVGVVGTAISVQIQNAVSTAVQIQTAIAAFPAAAALVDTTVTGGGGQNTQAITALQNGVDNTITPGARVLEITPSEPIIIQTGDTTAGNLTINNCASIAGIILGETRVTGTGIPDGAVVTNTTGVGPYDIDIDLAPFRTATGVDLTFLTAPMVTLDENALSTQTVTPIDFYVGAQVGYRVVFGRIDTDVNGGTVTRLGAPSPILIAVSIEPTSTNVEVNFLLPKNSEDEITFFQLYRSPQTASAEIVPIDQYQLVYERALDAADFTNRSVLIQDTVPDSLRGVALYAGSDREGISQANNPPPAVWDMCVFRNFALYANATQPTTLKFTIISVGAPNGIQINDTITISGTFLGVAFTETYTGKAAQNGPAREFKVFTTGTPSQNITDTTNSLITMINYDWSLPVHAILLSTSTDLPGQILLEADYPSLDLFQITASLHQDAYDPALDDLESDLNTINNGVYVSKLNEIQAVPALNLVRVGDSSSNILRVIPLRDYVIVLKTDGIYKIQGTTPNSLVVLPFDLTTKIIGADTAVALNSAVWMYSNQGVVAISDGGVENKSLPVDNELYSIVGAFLPEITADAFAIAYESDRKYILSLPAEGDDFTTLQYGFNYVTNTWTNWDRNLDFGFIHSIEDKLYVSCADADFEGVSQERKTSTFLDFVDEPTDKTIISINGKDIVLNNVTEVFAGDILYKDVNTYSIIMEVDDTTNTVTVQSAPLFVAGAVEVLRGIECTIQWKQVFADNPSYAKQYAEGLVLFKRTRFAEADISFVTDFSLNPESNSLLGPGTALWGFFPWGEVPWGGYESGVVSYTGISAPASIRFGVPESKQYCSYISPTLTIRQGFSDFILMGLSFNYTPSNEEVGK